MLTFCIGYRNRFEHLKQTFDENIKLILSYDDVNILFLQYGFSESNPNDHAVPWLEENYGTYIGNRLNIFETTEPTSWDMSHSKNCTHVLANSDYVCNLDVDNFIGEEFLKFSYEFVKNNDMQKHFIRKRGRGQGGRFLVKRSVFMSVGGYDERMNGGWGHEDGDLHERLERFGLKRVRPPEFPFIDHGLDERARELPISYKESKNLHADIRRQNTENGVIQVNERGFGKGSFFKNLNYENIVVIE